MSKWIATAALGVALWLVIDALEALAVRGWMGPVIEANLASGRDAGVLFYTEVETEVVFR